MSAKVQATNHVQEATDFILDIGDPDDITDIAAYGRHVISGIPASIKTQRAFLTAFARVMSNQTGAYLGGLSQDDVTRFEDAVAREIFIQRGVR